MRNPKPYLVLLTAMYAVGVAGLNLPQTQALFQWLTPFNLLVSLAVLLLFHQQWNKGFIWFCIIAFSVGFLIELAGVHTKAIFGAYHYETTLGVKIWGVPPLIGINWLLLIYCAGSSFCRISLPLYMKVIYGALLLTVLDFLIEPVAVRLNMWSWETPNPPVQNFVAWFIVATVLLTLFHTIKFREDNPIARWLLILQICFFGIQNLFF